MLGLRDDRRLDGVCVDVDVDVELGVAHAGIVRSIRCWGSDSGA
jgi:hypothetical protein